MAVEWRMFPLCLSQCPGWLNPSKNVLLVFLRMLINTLPKKEEKKNSTGDIPVCGYTHTGIFTLYGQFTLRLALLVSLVVGHNKQPSHWLRRGGLPFAGVLNGLHITMAYETVQDFAACWHEWAVVKPVQTTSARIYLIILLRKYTGPSHDPKYRFNTKRPNSGLISRY